jgi:hypothetical protein
MYPDRENVTCRVLAARLEQPVSGLAAAELEHLALCDSCAELLLTHALRQAPAVEVPAGFAARVGAQLPAQSPAPLHGSRRLSGFSVALAASAALLCAASLGFALDPRIWLPSGTAGVLLGTLLVTELVGISLWLGEPRPWR